MELESTIKPEHMARWEELVRAGEIHLYEYDQQAGYYRVSATTPFLEHGTVACYQSGCRVDACREAYSKNRIARRGKTPATYASAAHGTITHWLTGCDAPECLDAGERYRAMGGTLHSGALS